MPGLLKFYYHKINYNSGDTDWTFFTAVGADDMVNNLSQAGRIDKNMAFDVHSLRLFFCSAAQGVNTTVRMLMSIIRLYVGDTIRLRVPAWMCPGGGGPVSGGFVSGLTTSDANVIVNGTQDARGVFVLDPPITIPPDTSFKVVVEAPVDPAFSTTDPDIWMVLGGREY